MNDGVLTIDEAIIAATYERISKRINGRAWIEILVEWQESGESEPTIGDQLKRLSGLSQLNLDRR